MVGHKSSTKTDLFLLHQRFALPCVWAAVIHGRGVAAPPNARLPLQEVKAKRMHCKRKVVRQSPNEPTSKASLGWKNGTVADFCHGCLLECPPRMGEDLM